MAGKGVLRLALWSAALLAVGLACPELCTCSDRYGRHMAECSYKDLLEVPEDLPPNVTMLSLSVNKISVIPAGSLDNASQVTSLWLANNQIVTIEPGALLPLLLLRNFDISHNKIEDFPWEDLVNLTALQLLKMNHNRMSSLPRDAFHGLRDLHSLRLNNNRFLTIAQGTFDGLLSLSHLQIHDNSYVCTCTLDWLREWISTTSVKVQEQESITCASPEDLRGEEISKLPESKCASPNATIQMGPGHRNATATFQEDTLLILTCQVQGNPKPLVSWSIQTQNRRRELTPSEDDSLSADPLKVLANGTLVISRLRKRDGGNYSCSATNQFGRADDWVSVEVAPLPRPTPPRKKPTTTTTTSTPVYVKVPSKSKQPYVYHPTAKATTLGPPLVPDLPRKDRPSAPPPPPPQDSTEVRSESAEEESGPRSPAGKCGRSASTQYVPSQAFNGSAQDVKQYTFDFGVIALGVSETEAIVRLNPLLIPRESGVEHSGGEDPGEGGDPNGLYLCVAADRKHQAVQWSRIEEGVNTYRFGRLRPGTNYSLCLTYRGEECEVQVLFATRRKVTNLLVIVSVSICLLTVSTVPLLGATCFHLVYKYRGKTYKLILKAKDQYHMERSLNASFGIHAPHTESQRKINGSQLDEEEEEDEGEEEGDSESMEGDKEGDTEESVVTDSLTLSQCRGNTDDCEVGSQYSDRLPLGAEALNINTNYK